MSDSPLLPGLKAADFGLFGATWWPEARWERLRIATYLATWVRARSRRPKGGRSNNGHLASYFAGMMVSKNCSTARSLLGNTCYRNRLG